MAGWACLNFKLDGQEKLNMSKSADGKLNLVIHAQNSGAVMAACYLDMPLAKLREVANFILKEWPEHKLDDEPVRPTPEDEFFKEIEKWQSDDRAKFIASHLPEETYLKLKSA
jgi:hypothetical protein